MYNENTIGAKMENPKSIWVSWLDKNNNDPYKEYKSILAIKVEELIGSVQYELLQKHQMKNSDEVKKLAINLLMEQFLQIQYENSPEKQKAMIINLFTEHPIVEDFRLELVEEFTKKMQYINKKASKFQKMKMIFHKYKKIFKVF